MRRDSEYSQADLKSAFLPLHTGCSQFPPLSQTVQLTWGEILISPACLDFGDNFSSSLLVSWLPGGRFLWEMHALPALPPSFPSLQKECPFSGKETKNPWIHREMELALPAQGTPTLFVSLPFPNTPNEDVFTTLQGKYPHTPPFHPWKFSLCFIFITSPNHGAFPLSSHLPDVLLLGDDLQVVQSSPGVSWPLPHRILQVLAAPLPFMRTQTGLWVHHTETKHRPGDLLEPPEPPSVPGAVYSRE